MRPPPTRFQVQLCFAFARMKLNHYSTEEHFHRFSNLVILWPLFL